MLTALIGPLLFAVLGGLYAYIYRPERRESLMATLVCFLLVGAYAYHKQPLEDLFLMLLAFALMVCGMFVHSLQRAAVQPGS